MPTIGKTVAFLGYNWKMNKINSEMRMTEKKTDRMWYTQRVKWREVEEKRRRSERIFNKVVFVICHTANSASFNECVDMPPVLFRLLRLCSRSVRNESCSSLSRLDKLILHTRWHHIEHRVFFHFCTNIHLYDDKWSLVLEVWFGCNRWIYD